MDVYADASMNVFCVLFSEFLYCSNIRELSAEGLHCLTANAPQYMAKEGRIHHL